MIDKDMLEAMRAMMKEELEPINDRLNTIDRCTNQLNDRLDTIDQRTNRLEVLLEHDIPHDIRLLAEGYEGILDRLPEAEEVDTLRARIRVLEKVVTDHTKAINELRQA